VTFPINARRSSASRREEKSASNIVHHDWVSLVRFRYSGVPIANQMRFDNPLGFQATEYRRDQETAPSPNTSGGQTGAQKL